MKLVVFSDVHGKKELLERVLNFNPDADYLISLGDNELPNSYIEKKNIITVKGNYPFDSGKHFEQVLYIEEFKVFMTHGHKYGVRRGIDQLQEEALINDYDICLFGHTHIAYSKQIDNVFYMNPGSVSRSRSYVDESYLVINLERGKEITYQFKNAFTNENMIVGI